ncbi:helix-turn-helix domain-containing protein [Bacillus sp. 1P06AnD]|uniref:helix-turn-helix domain-containing protein n=1 Tax=Bacillus sp. 1P06AnD TaxID=3132208 RepID=UPI0039A16035
MIGERIKKCRKKRHLTLNQLADQTGISKSYLSNIERGLQQNPSLNVLSKIAASLDVKVEDLLGTKPAKIDLEPGWVELLQEVQEQGITLEEFSFILGFIKYRKSIADEKK